jgi:hypothetical protein
MCQNQAHVTQICYIPRGVGGKALPGWYGDTHLPGHPPMTAAVCKELSNLASTSLRFFALCNFCCESRYLRERHPQLFQIRVEAVCSRLYLYKIWAWSFRNLFTLILPLEWCHLPQWVHDDGCTQVTAFRRPVSEFLRIVRNGVYQRRNVEPAASSFSFFNNPVKLVVVINCS